MTDSVPSAVERPSAISLHKQLLVPWGVGPGFRRYSAVNHSILGLRFVYTGFFFFLVGGLLAMLIRTQLATSENAFMNHETYNQVFTMHGTVMMFLFALPVLEGFSFYLLPKMLGSRDLAFPRLSAYGYWCYVFGASLLLLSLFFGFAPNAGWFMYTPLSSRPFTPGINSDVWLLGVTFVEISAICAGVEIIVSILKVRASGMSLNRMPLFAWYLLVVAFMIVLGFPPLVLGSILLETERAFNFPFFDPTRGGDPLLWQHLFWLFGHPEVYILFLPGAAIVSTLVPTFARHPIIGYKWVVAAVVATGFISFGLWVHHMFAVGIPYLAEIFFSAASMMVAVPTGIQVFSWIATLWAGKPVMRLPMLYLFGFLVTFVIGGLTGVMVALVPFDWQVHDTQFIVAHLHYVLIGGVVFPMLAGAYYWMPHVTGRMPSERLGTIAFWLIFIGMQVTFFLMHLTGLLGMPRRVYTYEAGLGWDWLNLVSSIGGFVTAAGFGLFLIDVFVHARVGRLAPRNPWGAGTLEWAMATPSPNYNMASLPVIDSRDPLIDHPDLPAQAAAGRFHFGEAHPNRRETMAVDMVTGKPDHVLLLPGPTWVPLAAGLATGVFFMAFLLSWYWIAAGGASLTLLVLLYWAWKNGEKVDPVPAPAGMGLSLMPNYAVASAPGWWGMAFALLANASLLASMLFGYLYITTVAPDSPPREYFDLHPWASLVAVVALGVGALGSQRALAATLVDSGARSLWLIVSMIGGLLACGAAMWVPLVATPSPQEHAYVAVVTMLTGYVALHALLGAVFAAYVILRCRAGYVSPIRSLDPRILWQWWLYTAATGVLVFAAIQLTPLALGR
jgi:cytochrome c oxidase subunit I+III